MPEAMQVAFEEQLALLSRVCAHKTPDTTQTFSDWCLPQQSFPAKMEPQAENAVQGKTSPHARNKILYKLMNLGESKCKDLIADYNQCCKGRAASMVFACRGKYTASQDCMHHYMNDDNVHLVERRWIEQGRPRKPNWDVLMTGIEEDGDRKFQAATAAATAAKP